MKEDNNGKNKEIRIPRNILNIALVSVLVIALVVSSLMGLFDPAVQRLAGWFGGEEEDKYEEARQYLTQQKQQEAFEQHLEELWEESEIEKYQEVIDEDDEDAVVAAVNGEELMLKEFREIERHYEEQFMMYGMQPGSDEMAAMLEEERDNMLRSMIEYYLLMQRAEEEGITLDPEEEEELSKQLALNRYLESYLEDQEIEPGMEQATVMEHLEELQEASEIEKDTEAIESGREDAVAVTVNGEEIMVKDYLEIKEQQEQQLAQYGLEPGSPEMEEELEQQREQIIEHLIRNTILEQRVREEGIVPSEEQMAEISRQLLVQEYVESFMEGLELEFTEAELKEAEEMLQQQRQQQMEPMPEMEDLEDLEDLEDTD